MEDASIPAALRGTFPTRSAIADAFHQLSGEVTSCLTGAPRPDSYSALQHLKKKQQLMSLESAYYTHQKREEEEEKEDQNGNDSSTTGCSSGEGTLLGKRHQSCVQTTRPYWAVVSGKQTVHAHLVFRAPETSPLAHFLPDCSAEVFTPMNFGADDNHYDIEKAAPPPLFPLHSLAEGGPLAEAAGAPVAATHVQELATINPSLQIHLARIPEDCPDGIDLVFDIIIDDALPTGVSRDQFHETIASTPFVLSYLHGCSKLSHECAVIAYATPPSSYRASRVSDTGANEAQSTLASFGSPHHRRGTQSESVLHHHRDDSTSAMPLLPRFHSSSAPPATASVDPTLKTHNSSTDHQQEDDDDERRHSSSGSSLHPTWHVIFPGVRLCSTARAPPYSSHLLCVSHVPTKYGLIPCTYVGLLVRRAPHIGVVRQQQCSSRAEPPGATALDRGGRRIKDGNFVAVPPQRRISLLSTSESSLGGTLHRWGGRRLDDDGRAAAMLRFPSLDSDFAVGPAAERNVFVIQDGDLLDGCATLPLSVVVDTDDVVQNVEVSVPLQLPSRAKLCAYKREYFPNELHQYVQGCDEPTSTSEMALPQTHWAFDIMVPLMIPPSRLSDPSLATSPCETSLVVGCWPSTRTPFAEHRSSHRGGSVFSPDLLRSRERSMSPANLPSPAVPRSAPPLGLLSPVSDSKGCDAHDGDDGEAGPRERVDPIRTVIVIEVRLSSMPAYTFREQIPITLILQCSRPMHCQPSPSFTAASISTSTAASHPAMFSNAPVEGFYPGEEAATPSHHPDLDEDPKAEQRRRRRTSNKTESPSTFAQKRTSQSWYSNLVTSMADISAHEIDHSNVAYHFSLSNLSIYSYAVTQEGVFYYFHWHQRSSARPSSTPSDAPDSYGIGFSPLNVMGSGTVVVLSKNPCNTDADGSTAMIDNVESFVQHLVEQRCCQLATLPPIKGSSGRPLNALLLYDTRNGEALVLQQRLGRRSGSQQSRRQTRVSLREGMAKHHDPSRISKSQRSANSPMMYPLTSLRTELSVRLRQVGYYPPLSTESGGTNSSESDSSDRGGATKKRLLTTVIRVRHVAAASALAGAAMEASDAHLLDLLVLMDDGELFLRSSRMPPESGSNVAAPTDQQDAKGISTRPLLSNVQWAEWWPIPNEDGLRFLLYVSNAAPLVMRVWCVEEKEEVYAAAMLSSASSDQADGQCSRHKIEGFVVLPANCEVDARVVFWTEDRIDVLACCPSWRHWTVYRPSKVSPAPHAGYSKTHPSHHVLCVCRGTPHDSAESSFGAASESLGMTRSPPKLSSGALYAAFFLLSDANVYGITWDDVHHMSTPPFTAANGAISPGSLVSADFTTYRVGTLFHPILANGMEVRDQRMDFVANQCPAFASLMDGMLYIYGIRRSSGELVRDAIVIEMSTASS